jgi:hypothetical protein
MPVPTPEQLGPLAGLVGSWEGDEGVDVAYANERQEVWETPFRERASFSPFGPVDNGKQHLYGLDYRMAAWRTGEEDPFHTEVGYWLWDADAGQLMRCFMVPRGSTLLAGGPAHAEDTEFTLQAEVGSETYGILSNQYLAIAARTVLYQCMVKVDGDSFSYEQTTTVDVKAMGGPMEHTDKNRLHRIEG